MAKINEKKLELYANKLYRGELARYKENLGDNDLLSITSFFQEEDRTRRVPTSRSQEKMVIKNCKNKCALCGKPYEDRDDFDFHHVNGDRSKTVTTNLILVCLGCHRKIHTKAKAKLKDYNVKKKRRKSEGSYGLPEIDMPEDNIL